MASFKNRYDGKRVLLTGHTGFKGSWLSLWLKELGAEVVGYSNAIPTEPSLFEQAHLDGLMTTKWADVRALDDLKTVIQELRPDFVFHLAAQAIVSTSYADPIETISTNVMGTATVLEALRSIDWPCTAIIITSDKAYENVEWVWGYREDDRIGGKDIYSGSKGAAELIFRSYFYSFFRHNTFVRLATVRAGNVIGGGDWAADRIVADCVRAWQQDHPVTIRSPNATRPWQHVLEPLSGYLSLGSALSTDDSLNGESFNFGPRSEITATVAQLLMDLAAIWGHEDVTKSYQVVDEIPFHEAGLLKLNIDKAAFKLKWAPTLSYEECVSFTGKWYSDVHHGGADPLSITQQQIVDYENLARARKVEWA